MTAKRSWEGPASGENTRLFVYGGLMRGFDLHHYLAGCPFAGVGWTAGALVEAGRYPGLIEGDGKVCGELYLLSDPAANLEALDELEDFDPANPQASAYVRVVREVHASDGTVTKAWVYVYNRDASGLAAVEGGDWRQRPTVG